MNKKHIFSFFLVFIILFNFVGAIQCSEGETKNYTCPDGTEVGWCHCNSENLFICVNSPENSCPITEEYVPGELILGFNEGISKEQAEELIEQLDLTLKQDSDLWNLNVLVINVPVGEEQTWIKTLEQESIVDYAELNGIVHAHEPEDTKNYNYIYYIIGAIILIIIIGFLLKNRKN